MQALDTETAQLREWIDSEMRTGGTGLDCSLTGQRSCGQIYEPRNDHETAVAAMVGR